MMLRPFSSIRRITYVGIAVFACVAAGSGIPCAAHAAAVGTASNVITDFRIVTTVAPGAAFTIESGFTDALAEAQVIYKPPNFSDMQRPSTAGAVPSVAAHAVIVGTKTTDRAEGVAVNSAGDPFGPQGIAMNSAAIVEGSGVDAQASAQLGVFGASGRNFLQFRVRVTGTAGVTIGFSFMDTLSLVASAPGVSASVSNFFEISDAALVQLPKHFLDFTPAELNTILTSSGNDPATLFLTQTFVSPSVVLGPGSYIIKLDPLVRVDVIPEPSTFLLMCAALLAASVTAQFLEEPKSRRSD